MYKLLGPQGFTDFFINPGDYYNIYSEYAFDLYVADASTVNSNPVYTLLYRGSSGPYVFSLDNFGITKASRAYIKSNSGRTFVRQTNNQGFVSGIVQNIENKDPYFYYNDPDTISKTANLTLTILAKSIFKGITLLTADANYVTNILLPTKQDIDAYYLKSLPFDNSMYFDFHFINIGAFPISIAGNTGNTLAAVQIIPGSNQAGTFRSAWFRMNKDANHNYVTVRIA